MSSNLLPFIDDDNCEFWQLWIAIFIWNVQRVREDNKVNGYIETVIYVRMNTIII